MVVNEVEGIAEIVENGLDNTENGAEDNEETDISPETTEE